MFVCVPLVRVPSGRKVLYRRRMVNRGKRLLPSARSKAVYLMNLRGSEGGCYFGSNVPVHLRTLRHLSRREGVAEARRF
jgi:hypothetical protein